MTESDPDESQESLPAPQVHQRGRMRVSMVWLVPLIAALVGLGLVVHSVLLAGPTITISFDNAEGLQQGKTEVKYKNVVVGKVGDISLDKNFQKVLVTVELTRSAEDLAVKNTQFWVVRPRVDWGGVSGLSTLLSGAYIGVDIGTSKEGRKHFEGLANPPAITHEEHGKKFSLHAKDLGSLSIGSPVYYREIAVGRVATVKLDADGKGVTVEVFIESPYDKYVTEHTRFWNASGFDLSLNSSGLTIYTQSLISILAGGIVFAHLPGYSDETPAAADSVYTLYSNKDTALAPLNGPSEQIRMQFHQSIKGLTIGAEVNFRGIGFGHVTSINLRYDPAHTDFWADVDAVVYPDRLGSAQQTIERIGEAKGPGHEELMAALVKKGLRAQLRTGNLITGKLYVTLDFFHNAKPVKFDPHQLPVQIPTVPGSLEQIQSQISDIVRKLNAIPYAHLSSNLDGTLRSTNTLLKQLHGQLAPQAQATLKQAQDTLAAVNQNLAADNSPLQQNTQRTLKDVRRAARSLSELANYLRRHPDALILGKDNDASPPPEPPLAAPPENPR